MSETHILLIDDDPREILERGLTEAGFKVTRATGSATTELLGKAVPDAVLARLATAGLDGSQLLSTIRGNEPLAHLPVVLLAESSHESRRADLFAAGATDWLVEPVSLAVVVDRLHSHLGDVRRGSGETRHSGPLAELAVASLLHDMANGGHTGVITCTSEDGDIGTIWVHDGQICDAVAPPLKGAAAFHRMLSWTEGHYVVAYEPHHRPVSIGVATEELLAEAIKRAAEWSRLAAQLPGFNAVCTLDLAALALRLGEVPEEANDVLRLIDGRHTLREVLDLSPFEDISTLTFLSVLHEETVLRVARFAEPPTRESTPAPVQAPEDLAPVEQETTPAPAPDAHPPAAAEEVPVQQEDSAPEEVAKAESRPVELHVFPSRKGVRRERLENESAQASAGGRPVELTEEVLPPGVVPSEELRSRADADDTAPSPTGETHPAEDPNKTLVLRAPRTAAQDEADPELEALVRKSGGAGKLALAAVALVLIGLGVAGLASRSSGDEEAAVALAGAEEKAPEPGTAPAEPEPVEAPEEPAEPEQMAQAEAPQEKPAPVVSAPKPAPTPAPRPVIAAAPPKPANPPAPKAPTFAELVAEGTKALKAEKFENAAEVLEKALELRRDAGVLRDLGRAHYELGNLEVALRHLRDATSMNSRDKHAFLFYGIVNQDMNRKDEAARAYRRFLFLEPEGTDQARTITAVLQNLER